MFYRREIWCVCLGLVCGCGTNEDADLKTAPKVGSSEPVFRSTDEGDLTKTFAEPAPKEAAKEVTEGTEAAVLPPQKSAAREPDPELPLDLESQRVLDDEERDNTPQVIALLTHKNPVVRERAIYWLDGESMSPKAIKPIAARFNDPNESVANSAGRALEEIEDVDTIRGIRAELIGTFEQGHPFALATSLKLLQKLPADDLPQAKELLPILARDIPAFALDEALKVLAQKGPAAKDAVPFILPLLENSDYNFGSDEEYSEVNEFAAMALGKIGATAPLIRLLDKEDESSQELGVIGLVHVRPLPANLRAKVLSVTNKSDWLKEEMLKELGHIRPHTPEVVKALTEGVSDEDADIRAAAVLGLGRLEPKPNSAFPLVVGALRDEEGRVRDAASKALARFNENTEQRVRALLVAVNDPRGWVDDEAIKSLKKSLDEAFPIMVKALENPDDVEEVRVGAIRAIEHYEIHPLKKPEIQTVAVLVLEETKNSVDLRAFAAEILVEMDVEHPLAGEALIAGLKHGTSRAALSAAAVTLKRIRTPEAVAALIDGLDRTEEYVAGYAAASLGDLDELAEPAIPRLLTLAKQKGHPARVAIVECLGDIPSQKHAASVMNALVELMDDAEEDVAAKAIEALRWIVYSHEDESEPPVPRKTLVPLLAKKLSHESGNVREAAADALEELTPESAAALSELIQGIHDENYGVKVSCLETLAKLGEAAKPAQAALVKLVQNEEESARSYALSALAGIKGDAEIVIPIFHEALKNEDLNLAAIGALAPYGEKAAVAVPDLLPHLNAQSDWIRERTAETLGAIGPKAEPALAKLSELIENDGNSSVRRNAAQAVMLIAPESKAAIEVVEAALKGNLDEGWLEEFREKNDKQFLAVLTKALEHADGQVRAGALRELKRLPDVPGREEAFVKALQDSQAEVRLQAVLALHEYGGHNREIAPVLVKSLGTKTEENQWEVRELIQEVGPRVLPGLIERATDASESKAVRQEALKLIGEMSYHARRAAPKLLAIATDPADPVRFHAALTLDQIDQHREEATKELTPVLVAAARSNELDEESKQQAIHMLGDRRKDDALARKTLFEIVNDPKAEEHLRRAASGSLGQHSLSEAEIRGMIPSLDRAETRELVLGVWHQQRPLPAETLAPLIAQLKRTTDERDYLLRSALENTGELGIDALAALATDTSAPLLARKHAVAILGQYDWYHDEKLETTLKSKLVPFLAVKDLREEAALVIASFGEPSDAVLDILVSVLRGNDENKRYQAVNALRAAGNEKKPWPEAIEKIKPLLQSENAELKQSALSALVAVAGGSKDALRLVLATLEDMGDKQPFRQIQWELESRESTALILAELLTENPSPLMQWFCVVGLAGIDEPHPAIASALRPLVNHEDAEIAFHASVALAKHATDDAAALPTLLKAITTEDVEDEDRQKQWVAIDAIGRIGREAAPAVPRLMELMEDDESGSQAMLALARIGEPAKAAIPKIAKAFRERRFTYEAANALVVFGPLAEAAVPELVNAVREEYGTDSAIRALLEIGPRAKAVIPILQEQLQDEVIRADALNSLARLGPLATDTEADILPWVSDPDAETRAAAFGALAAIPEISPDTLSRVVLGLEDEDAAVRYAAARVLWRHPGHSEVVALQTAMKDSDESVQRTAVRALGAMGPRAGVVVEDLIGWITTKDHPLKSDALVALGEIGSPAKSAVPKLIAIAQADSDDYLDSIAATVVWRIDPQAAKAAGLPAPPPAYAEKPRQGID